MTKDKTESPLLVRPRRACEMLGCKMDRLYALINAGEVESFTEGHARWIEVASIGAYIRRRIEENRRAREAAAENAENQGKNEL